MNPDANHPLRRLLVVDDDHDQADALCEWIALSSNWAVVAAYSPDDAIAQAQALPPEAIILDMEMNGVDGFDTAERLSQLSREKRIVLVALTGNARLHGAASRDARFAVSMLKPTDPPQLIKVLTKLFDP